MPRIVQVAASALLLIAASASAAPRPSVARIVVQEHGAVAYGSGTLIDKREKYGLVVTNWHVVRDATGRIDVLFPSGFRSQARAVKLDEDWDLAALVIWRPDAEPVPISPRPPRPGEPLTICGYGQGDYREATGRCTDFYAPEVGLPHELVELSVEARQGDSGGPILNRHGELAGVLFGAGQGTTLGSFAPRVGTFLASLAPGIGQPGGESPPPETPPLVAQARPRELAAGSEEAESPWRSLRGPQELTVCSPAIGGCCDCECSQQLSNVESGAEPEKAAQSTTGRDAFAPWPSTENQQTTPTATAVNGEQRAPVLAGQPKWFAAARDLLALLGLAFVFLQLVRAVA